MGEYADDALDMEFRQMGVFGFRGGFFGSFDPELEPRPYQHVPPDYFRKDYDGDVYVVCGPCGLHAVLANGFQVYGRRDLENKAFWVCTKCGDRVGCHPHTNEPLGYLANAATRAMRSRLHAAFDPIWRKGAMSRGDAYQWLAWATGIEVSVCHFGMMDLDQLQLCFDAIAKRFPENIPNLSNIANFKF